MQFTMMFEALEDRRLFSATSGLATSNAFVASHAPAQPRLLLPARVSPGAAVGFNPQPDPPAEVGFDPQPDPPAADVHKH